MTICRNHEALEKIFKKILKFNKITFWDLHTRAWKIFESYGELLRFDALSIMMAAAKNSGREKLELVIISLETHHEKVKEIKTHDLFHDKLKADDIKHLLHYNATHDIFSHLFKEVGINILYPGMIMVSEEMKP